MRFLLNIFLPLLIFTMASGPAQAGKTFALSMHGTPALSEGFSHFPYADPQARQGGVVTYGVIGTFDGLNPFVIKNVRTTARGLFNDPQFGNMVFETMMVRSLDEPFTLYGLLAEAIEINDERTEITFYLNPNARFSDGEPVTQDDVLFTYDLLREKGRYPFRDYMKQIKTAEKVGKHGIHLHFTGPANRELALIFAGSIPVLPKHAINPDTFADNGFDIIPGSGAYVIEKVDRGNRIVYRRNPDYWGNNLAVNQGINNYEQVQIRYFRNDNTQFEAFKKGMLDVFIEDRPNRWRLGYDFPAVHDGRVQRESFKKGTPANMTGFVFNTRRPLFADLRVRKALSMVFDFEWVNRSLYGGLYTRTEGFWDGSPLSSIGRPASQRERALLAPFPGAVAQDVMEGKWHPIKTDGSGFDRRPLEAAWKMLLAAGFSRKGGKVFMPDGTPFRFEIMTQDLEEEKVALAYQRSLARLGIAASVRTVDSSQYLSRLNSFDYDMIISKLGASPSPGNEQLGRWASFTRDVPNSFNYAGVANPAVDAMIEALLKARSTEDFESAVRALDRILVSQNYYLPLYHLPEQWVARWSPVHHPEHTSLFGFRLPAWWRQAP